MKKWEKPTVNELGLKKTRENACPVNDSARTYWPDLTNGCPFGQYESINWFGRCKNFDNDADGNCKLNVSKIS